MARKISKLRLDICPIKDEYIQVYPVQVYPVQVYPVQAVQSYPVPRTKATDTPTTSTSTTCADCNRKFTDEYCHITHFCWPKPDIEIV